MKKVLIALLLIGVLVFALACETTTPNDDTNDTAVTTAAKKDPVKETEPDDSDTEEITTEPTESTTTEPTTTEEQTREFFNPEKGEVGDNLTVGTDAGMDGVIDPID